MTESPHAPTPKDIMSRFKPNHPVQQVSAQATHAVRQAAPDSTNHHSSEDDKPAVPIARAPFAEARDAAKGTPGVHAGLLYLRGLPSHDQATPDDPHPYAELVYDVAAVPVPTAYSEAYDRWDRMVITFPSTVVFTATTHSPAAIGLGATSPIEVGFTLHHTYGVPYLPGSALKGLARRSAERFHLSKQEMEILFGDDSETGSTSAGYITFWDGWLIPTTQPPLQSDVITVHHPEYYTSGNALLRSEENTGKPFTTPITPPTDCDDPNPVPFLSIPQGTSFAVVLTCQAESGEDDRALQWAQTAATILQYGLTTLGFGAKTNSGYGIFTVEPDLTKELKQL